jgi:putative Ca2+/H+ antiporter (TMEM165/GDT1 family)
MNLKLFFTVFGTILLAELGDKTQLAALALTGKEREPHASWVIFGASALALTCTSALAVGAGDILARTVSPTVIRWVSGLLFVGAGMWILLKG